MIRQATGMRLSRHPQSPTRITRVTQNVETEVSFVAGPGANLRYAYFRSSDSMASAIEGQDFLIFQQDEGGLAFVVCDGVGSSFCGNIAARVLGEGLLEFLWRLDPASASTPGGLAESVGAFLRQLRKEGESQVNLYQIDDKLPPLVRQALEQQRAYGSEAVFAAGRVDYPIEGQDEGNLLLCWMGDTQLHALDADGHGIDIGAEWTNKDRWSTTHGVKGRVHAWVGSTQGVERLLAFSDGLSAYADRLSGLSDGELEELIYKQLRSASSDDVALIDVALKTPHYMGLDEPATDPDLPVPQMIPLADPAFGQPFELGWTWEKKAKHYLLQVGGSPAFDHATTHTVQKEAWQVEAPSQPGRLYYRVRAVVGGGRMSRWSEPQPVRVAYPPPPAPDLRPIDDSTPGVPYSVVWSDVPHARVYVLEEAADPGFGDPRPVYRGGATGWTVDMGGRAPGTYHYRVQAISDGGPGAWSAPRKARLRIPPPPAPHLASLVPGQRHGEYTLRWSDVPEADHYEVHEADQDGQTKTFTTSDLAYSVRGQAEGKYTYRVRACAAHGHSEWSNAQQIAVGPREPAEEPQVRVEGPDQDGLLRVEWDEVERAETYTLEAALERDFRDVRSRSTPETWMEVRPAGPGEIFIRVRAENTGGPGPWSHLQRAVVPPTAPTWLEAEVQRDSQAVELCWAAVPGDITYQLELVVTEEGFEEASTLYQGSETEFRARLPDEIDTCEFRVRARAHEGTSAWTYSHALDVPRAPLPPRMDTPMVSPQNMVLLTWSASRGATHYLLEIGRDDSFADAQSVRCDSPQFTFDPRGRWRYWFRVRACRGELVGKPSQPVTLMLDRSDAPRLTPIRQVAPRALYTVTWSSVGGTQYYELQEASDPSFEAMERYRVFHPGLGYTFPGRSAGTYYYRVQAVDDQGRASDWSETLIVEIQ
jgi:hypothetical protein